MERAFRGFVEKDLDSVLKPEAIDNVITYSKEFPLKSVEDFCFGFIVGFVLTGHIAESRRRYGRDPTDAETKEVLDIVERRAMEIKGKIKLAMSK